ncbi:uncharacterized protein LOC118810985 [Colossoma macropomum]|uniref:uncharacterized protein LOC118810985 n=1 Tax=Colossoma macropomum TaxID=42526 RepID=UPI0018650C98|nr:uncharacterized protein LOC118810985 [Colossoma macropomum]
MAHRYDYITTERLRQENGNLKLEINKLRTQLQDRQNELHNFKERMGKVVDLTLGSSGVLSEDLTNPCRESELKHMYEKLSKNQWAKLLRQLKTGGPEMTKEKIKENRKKAEDVIQAVLRKSQHDIQNITGTMLRLTPSSQDPSNNSKYFDLAIQNLQLAIYEEKKELYNRDKLQDVPEALYSMIHDCYKTGCLMALHNPPLLLDWDSCVQGPFPPIKTGKFCPVIERDEETDTLRKSSAAQAGAQIPHGNREIVKPELVKEKEEDTGVLQKGPEPHKEREEDVNEAPRVTSLPVPAAETQTPTYQRQRRVPAKPDFYNEKEEDINNPPVTKPDFGKLKEEDINTSLMVSAPPLQVLTPQKRKHSLVSAPQQQPQTPQKHNSDSVKPAPQKQRQKNENAVQVNFSASPSRRETSHRPTGVQSSFALARMLSRITPSWLTSSHR